MPVSCPYHRCRVDAGLGLVGDAISPPSPFADAVPHPGGRGYGAVIYGLKRHWHLCVCRQDELVFSPSPLPN